MRVVTAFPPNYAAINAKFNIAGRPVIFAWGDIIYNPHHVKVTPELLAHEGVHGERQVTDNIDGEPNDERIRRWWCRYIEDDAFRLNEEVLAHRMERAVRISQLPGGRDNRRARLIRAETAVRLASPLYQFGISVKQAAELLEGGSAT